MIGINITQYVIAGLVAAALIGAVATGTGIIYGAGRTAGRHEAESANLKLREAVEEAATRASKLAADAIAKIDIQQVTINRRIERETRTNVVYADCRHATGVLDDLNETITGRRPDRVASPVVPATSAP